MLGAGAMGTVLVCALMASGASTTERGWSGLEGPRTAVERAAGVRTRVAAEAAGWSLLAPRRAPAGELEGPRAEERSASRQLGRALRAFAHARVLDVGSAGPLEAAAQGTATRPSAGVWGIDAGDVALGAHLLPPPPADGLPLPGARLLRHPAPALPARAGTADELEGFGFDYAEEENGLATRFAARARVRTGVFLQVGCMRREFLGESFDLAKLAYTVGIGFSH